MGNTINVTGPAQLGQEQGGAYKLRDEAWEYAHQNDKDQARVKQGIGVAQGQAQGPYQGAQRDQGLLNNASGGGDQAGAIELARRQALGLGGPSAAARQLQSGLNQGAAQQRAMAAGARGSAAIATASSNQAANTSNLQQTAFTNAGMLKSQEMAAGRGLYASLTGQQRSQDQQMLDQSNQFNQQNAQNQDGYRLGMGQAAVALGGVANGQNGQDLNWYQQGNQAVAAQDEANQQGQEWLSEARRQAAAQNAGGG